MIDIRNKNDWQKAVDSFNQGDLIGALYVFKKISRTRPTALVEIGNIYELGGGGVEQNFVEACKWYEKSVEELNDPKAHMGLGRLYFYGHGVHRNYDKALYHFGLLASEGERGALYALGLMSQYGLGIEINNSCAANYYRRAADLGHLLALRQLALLNFKQGHYISGAISWIKSSFMIFKAVMKDEEDPRVRIV